MSQSDSASALTKAAQLKRSSDLYNNIVMKTAHPTYESDDQQAPNILYIEAYDGATIECSPDEDVATVATVDTYGYIDNKMSFSDQVVGGQYTISGEKPRIIIYQGKAINNTGMIDFFMYKCCKTSGVETPRGLHVDYRRCEGDENKWICIRDRDRRI